MKRISVAIVSLALSGLGLSCVHIGSDPVEPEVAAPASDEGPWSPGSMPKEKLQIEIVPLRCFTGSNRAKITAWREESKAREPKLRSLLSKTPGKTTILQQMEDGLPWQGILCNPYYIQDVRADSLGSLSILNPFLLCHFQFEGGSADGTKNEEMMGKAIDVYRDQLRAEFVPSSIVLDGPAKRLTVTHRLGPKSYMLELAKRAAPDRAVLLLETTNAADLGLNYFSVNSRETKGMRYVPTNIANHYKAILGFDKPMPTSQYYKSIDGNNRLYCRVGGLITVSLEKCPAQLDLDFWRNSPPKVNPPPPDFHETILIEPAR